MPFLIREMIAVDGVTVVDRTSPAEFYEVESVQKTFRIEGREVTVIFEFDGPLRSTPSRHGPGQDSQERRPPQDTPHCPWL